ncbi:filamentous hemagglutinin N-terminal domain-containing protein [Phormidesmis sp. 146-35]
MIQSKISKHWSLQLLSPLAISGIIAVSEHSTCAQVVPDTTLGAEQSIVTPGTNNGSLRQQIEGGATRGSNLFHSFRDFNIPEGQSLYFQAPLSIQNIISRVTGGSPSNIEGTLGVSGGTANLFLLNPSGILFGANARLDVGGSFVATTASAIQFGTQGFFSSSAPEAPPLLTVNPSALLFNQVGRAAIVNRSTAPLESGGRGLQVPEGQSLILLGGNVNLAGGGMNAAGGRVELGAVAGIGTVGLSPDDNRLGLSFPETLDRTDISLTNGATVNASGEGGGSIQIWGRRVFMNGGSQVATITQGAKPGGSLIVNASESFEVIGIAPVENVSTLSFGDGKAGDLTILTRNLSVRDGAQIIAGTLGNGSAGHLRVNASESVEVAGRGGTGSFSFLGSFTGSVGQAGNLTVNTRRLTIRDGGALSTEAQLSFENGRASQVSGEGGNLTINASDSVELIRDGFIFTGTQGAGNAGNLTINTGRLLLQNKSAISSNSSEAGNAGNIAVRAQSIALNNQSEINAETITSQGGNIALQVQDFLLLRQGSLISTTAGTAQAGGNGGNITIDGKFIVAVLRENSDITANAFSGRGGNIRITTQGIFGIEPRFRETSLSDITASSEFGISGTVTLNTPDVDPSRGLVTLPTELRDTSGLIASGCPADEGNSFSITGNGGLPEDPRQPLMGNGVWLDDRATGQSQSSIPQSVPTIVEAQGWIRDSNGQVTLVATHPDGMTQTSQPLLCSLLKNDR